MARPGESCVDCLYAVVPEWRDSIQCRRHAPVLIDRGNLITPRHVTTFPDLPDGRWCGDFERATGHEEPQRPCQSSTSHNSTAS